MNQNWELIEKIEVKKPFMDIAPIDSHNKTYMAWRCTWDIVDGDESREGGCSYSISRTNLDKFVDGLKTVVDPMNPKLHLLPKGVKCVKIGEKLFTQLAQRTSGLLHTQEGFHEEDFEPFLS